MGLPNISTSPFDYVVLDVETNGIKSKKCDLLSISLLKPDDGREYERFLPLDLNCDVYTTDINGIRKRDLKGKKHLVQREIDEMFEAFELDRRTILHFGSLDPRFVRDYFARHGLDGFDRMRFFNFKRLICSTGYSDGSLTKDNLCDFFGIKGVEDVHSGLRDCHLEWELFKKLDGRYLLARIVPCGQYFGMWRLAALNPGYILPVSYLSTYANLSRIIERPYIRCDAEEVYRLEIKGEDIKRFPTNFSGMIVENLLDTMIGAFKADNMAFLQENSAKNELLGYMPSYIRFTPMSLNGDGTVTAAHKEDEKCERELNAMVEQARAQLTPLVEFIRDKVFHGAPVTSQELVVNDELGILALCDLSTEDTVLEIKTSRCEPERYAEQLYYEARGRASYLLGMEWGLDGKTLGAALTLKRVRTYPGEKPNKKRDRATAAIVAALDAKGLDLVEYVKSTEPIRVRCRECGTEWGETYARVKSGKCSCPTCHPTFGPRRGRPRKGEVREPAAKPSRMTPEEALRRRAERYAAKVETRSKGVLVVDQSSYTGARDNVRVACRVCGQAMEYRADHLLERCYCRNCGSGCRH
ncbi:exonuclease domain-containing protein [Enorma sp.]|uniref:exonuclease domain-containing protein n=1 Tax=Enorma sp. TaxID=1920692 RepID=UPI0025C33D89|nr:exonuclease domain-containing protein [Enorma sp.]